MDLIQINGTGPVLLLNVKITIISLRNRKFLRKFTLPISTAPTIQPYEARIVADKSTALKKVEMSLDSTEPEAIQEPQKAQCSGSTMPRSVSNQSTNYHSGQNENEYTLPDVEKRQPAALPGVDLHVAGLL